MTDQLTARAARFRELIAANPAYAPDDKRRMEAAFAFAQNAHGGQKRRSGEPFFIHPLETAISLLEWRLDAATVCAGLLHDVLEDTEIPPERLGAEFGEDVLGLVEAVTKIALAAKRHRGAPDKKALGAEYQMRVFASVAKDPRAMIVKLADRLHNLRTIEHLPADRRRAIAQETFDVYANIAGRLGMYALKTVLLDGSFAVIDPDAYQKTVALLDEYRARNGAAWAKTEAKIRSLLDEAGIAYAFESRIKGVWSTHKKLNGSIRLSNVHDVFAMRVIVSADLDVYHALGLIHLNFRHIPRFFKDYVSMPKQNLYQSVHTTVLDGGAPVEVQIRTRFMDENGKLGIASHWRYKENRRDLVVAARDRLQLDAFLDATGRDGELIKRLAKTPTVDVIVTNDGKTHSMPATSTVLELAYRSDPARFAFAQAAFRFGEKLPWDARPESGDAIEFAYADAPTVSEKWLRCASHPAVRRAISELLRRAEEGEHASARGLLLALSGALAGKRAPEDEIARRLRALGLGSLREYAEYARALRLSERDAVAYFAAGSQWRSAAREIRRRAPRWAFYRSYFEYVDVLRIKAVQAPKCCTKLPGQPVVGVVAKNVLYAHRPDCDAVHGAGRKLVPLRWSQKVLAERPRRFRARLTVSGPWGPAAPNAVVNSIVRNGGSLHGLAIVRDKAAGRFDADVSLYVQDADHLARITADLGERNANFT